MTEFVTSYGLFLAKTITFVIALLIIIASIMGLSGKSRKPKGELSIEHKNDEYQYYQDHLHQVILSKEQQKQRHKQQKRDEKAQRKAAQKIKPGEEVISRKRMYIVNFKGDIHASQVDELRETITALLKVATTQDEIVIGVESPGGQVHGYGLAASQLARIRARKIPLTVVVDKVAASGGYLMACVADQIIAAPFAILGSIGVVAQLPNFHRLLKKHDVDYEQLTAGEYKRTLSLFAENTAQGREKFQQEIDDTHELFKQFVKTYRAHLDIEQIATGEHWFGTRALELHLIDKIQTSDDYFLACSEQADLYEVKYELKKSFSERFHLAVTTALAGVISR